MSIDLKLGQITLVESNGSYRATFDVITDLSSGMNLAAWGAGLSLSGFELATNTSVNFPNFAGVVPYVSGSAVNIGWYATGNAVSVASGPSTIGTVTVEFGSLGSEQLSSLNLGVTFNAAMSYWTDDAGNNDQSFNSLVGTSFNYAETVTPPTVTTTVTVDGAAPIDQDPDGAYDLDASDGSVEVAYHFSKTVTGFDQADLSYSGFTLNSFTQVDALNYVARFDPQPQNTFNGQINLNGSTGITDSYGNQLNQTGLQPIAFEGDTQAPAAPITGLSVRGIYGDPTPADGVVSQWVNFEAMLNGEADALVYLDGVLIDPDYSQITASVLYAGIGIPAEGAHTLRYALVDSVGNQSALSAATTFTVDATAPELFSIVQQDPAWVTAQTPDLWFEVTFSEGVSAVDISDFTLSVGGQTYDLTDAAMAFLADVRDSIGAPPSYSTSGGTNSTLDDTYYVRVGTTSLINAGLTTQDLDSATLELKSLIYVQSTESIGSGNPPDVDQSHLTGGAASNTEWFRVTLSDEYTGTTASLPYDALRMGFDDPTWSPSAGMISVDKVLVSSSDPSVLYVRLYGPNGMFPEGINFSANHASYFSATSPIGGSNIVDAAGNYFGYNYSQPDEVVTLDPATPYGEVTAPDSTSGWDVLDLTDLNGSVVVYATGESKVLFTAQGGSGTGADYLIGEFDKYVINSAQDGTVFFGSDRSELVSLSGSGATVDGAGVSGDDSTDIVSYARTSDGIVVDLSTRVANKVEVTRGSEKDFLTGIEGIVGSSDADSITGSLKDNILFGENYRDSEGASVTAGGDDVLDGGKGDDILFGGVGQGDILRGGDGTDILIDFDGGTLQGDAATRTPVDVGRDIYVVRSGPVNIENLHLSAPGTGLAGRHNLGNDVIVFSFNVAALAATLSDVVLNHTQTVDANEVVDVEALSADVYSHMRWDFEDVEGTDSQNLVLYYDADGLEGGDVVLSKVELTHINSQLSNANGRPFSLEAVEIEGYNLMDQVSSALDPLMVDRLVGGLFSDEVVDVAIALEAVREGTQRESNARGVMAGDNSLDERIFNPGFGDQRIVGSHKSDRYEFITQDFTQDNNGQATTNAGKDKIFDIGGDDVLTFSDAHIEDLDFTAIAQGRESSPSTLKVIYTQTTGVGANQVTNSGEVTWTGHYREGGDLALESVSTADGDFAVAKTVYSYDEFGDRIDHPDLVASGGVDSIMVGRYNDTIAGHEDSFVIEQGIVDADAVADGKQHVYLWNVDQTDSIDLSDFVVTNKTVDEAHDTATISTKIGTDDLDLVLHFMDFQVTATKLDDLLAHAA